MFMRFNFESESGVRGRIEKAILHRKEVQEKAMERKGIKVPDFGIVDKQIAELEAKRDRLIQDLHLSPNTPAVQELNEDIKRFKKERGNGMNRKIETTH